jgi:hypothetical protein
LPPRRSAKSSAPVSASKKRAPTSLGVGDAPHSGADEGKWPPCGAGRIGSVPPSRAVNGPPRTGTAGVDLDGSVLGARLGERLVGAARERRERGAADGEQGRADNA